MDTTTAALILAGLAVLFMWGFYLGYQFGRTTDR
jgi:hypothetical protein